MKIYKGYKVNTGAGKQPAWVTEGEWLTMLPLQPSLEICNHSPSGFNWGYGGSGPAQLALAILFDLTGDKELSYALHQRFKRDFVSKWTERWFITEADIRSWILNNLADF